ncbi:MAG TPA: ester cyclase [Tepidisphaeraceae bacterium]|jgi:predicted ester cyclase
MSTETERNKELTRRWFAEVWNQRREATIDELMSPEAIAHGLSPGAGGPLKGPAAFRIFWNQFGGAFPDMNITVEDLVAEGDRVAARIRFTGTHQGHHLGAAPTGKRIIGTGITLCRWENGQIVDGWNEFDALGVFLATGVAKLT